MRCSNIEDNLSYKIANQVSIALFKMVINDLNILIQTCVKAIPTSPSHRDYKKVNSCTQKDHFSLPFITLLLEEVGGHERYTFMDGYTG